MKNTALKFALLVLLLASSLPIVKAQGDQSKVGSKGTTVTGCLQKGDETGEYALTKDDGTRYGLRSQSVDLSQHLGHTVTVSGTTIRENEKNEKNEKKETEESSHLRVNTLKMVSAGCK